MQLIRPDIDIPFVNLMKPAGIASTVLIIISLAAFLMKGGLIYGIDFAGERL